MPYFLDTNPVVSKYGSNDNGFDNSINVANTELLLMGDTGE